MRYSRRKSKRHQVKEVRYRINEQIRVPQVKLIDEAGEFLGVMDTHKAIEIAREKEFTLVEVSPKEDPPVAKIVDYGKMQYKKQREAQKQKALQKKTETKGIKLSVRIGKHDIDFRRKQAEKFLDSGNKVKIELNLRGREKQHKPLAREIIQNFINEIKKDEKREITMEEPIKYKGNGFSVIISQKI
ncbi:translation initiation factor IF-3 [Candidatus Falkowbacteria bacterium]|jgi:translation initiation factor IF-3|nr:translation initiation factor IF-3 [Candidatus Falkowbacteria bacterium]MBT4433425.1 translation initiation factor IF-3 [Candidatus Falkowbacteria bacterium]